MIASSSRRIAGLFLGRIHSGSLTIRERGEQTTFGSGAPMATVHVRSPRAWPMLLRGSNGLAEAYARGLWSSADLTAVVRVAARNADGLDRFRRALAFLLAPMQRARTLLKRNTPH